ncbi:polysaccharide deacetylase family protein [Streptomyces vinaceus]|uniref:polysaccharide deacetylase family protein n=1 Tax=Streptomyces vinaceus TaxID=1960 RepID=UPI00380A422D
MSSKNRVRYIATAAVATAAMAMGVAGCATSAATATSTGQTGPHHASTVPMHPSVPAGSVAPSPTSPPARIPAAGTPTASAAAKGAVPAKGAIPSSFTKVSEGGPHTVNITIDDGPSPVWTPKILSVLAQNHAKATFCMIGKNAAKYPDLVKDVVKAGNRLCDHSLNHDMTMSRKSASYQSQEILEGQAFIDKAAGGTAKAQYYRAPGGAFTPTSRQIAAAHGMRPLGWDIDPKDWSRPGTESIINTVKHELSNGPIILFHDGGGIRSQTVSALQHLLPWLKQHGYGVSFPSQAG